MCQIGTCTNDGHHLIEIEDDLILVCYDHLDYHR